MDQFVPEDQLQLLAGVDGIPGKHHQKGAAQQPDGYRGGNPGRGEEPHGEIVQRGICNGLAPEDFGEPVIHRLGIGHHPAAEQQMVRDLPPKNGQKSGQPDVGQAAGPTAPEGEDVAGAFGLQKAQVDQIQIGGQ